MSSHRQQLGAAGFKSSLHDIQGQHQGVHQDHQQLWGSPLPTAGGQSLQHGEIQVSDWYSGQTDDQRHQETDSNRCVCFFGWYLQGSRSLVHGNVHSTYYIYMYTTLIVRQVYKYKVNMDRIGVSGSLTVHILSKRRIRLVTICMWRCNSYMPQLICDCIISVCYSE